MNTIELRQIIREILNEENYFKKNFQWKKVPSVTYGGKEYFYISNTMGIKYSVSWDRTNKNYKVEAEGNKIPSNNRGYKEMFIKGGFKTPEQGMKYAESWHKQNKDKYGLTGYDDESWRDVK